MHLIKCDICGKESNLNAFEHLGSFKSIKVLIKLGQNLEREQSVEEVTLDLCGECSTDVMEYITSLKTKKHVVTKTDKN